MKMLLRGFGFLLFITSPVWAILALRYGYQHLPVFTALASIVFLSAVFGALLEP